MSVRENRMTADGWRGVGKLVGRCAFAALFVLGGVGHFVVPDFYVKMMPPYLPWHRPLVLVSGAAEIALGALLLAPESRRYAAWGLVALLVAVFPANIYVYQHQAMFPLPPLAHLIRLPVQGVLILWALSYTKR